MKTRNVDLEHDSLLMNHICKYIVLEAPTVPELEKKIKNYETILITSITNVYRIYNLTLDYHEFYNISPNKNYQVGIYFNFNGKRKESIKNPEATLHHLKQLASLESKKQKTSHIVNTSYYTLKEVVQYDTIIIEANSESELDDIISNKQREYIQHLIMTTNLTNIFFFSKTKTKDAKTGKIILTMSVKYQARQTYKNNQARDKQDGR